MTKAQVLHEWRRDILSTLGDFGHPDYPLRRESWNVFTDMLCKDGQITERQYNDWTAPRECRG